MGLFRRLTALFAPADQSDWLQREGLLEAKRSRRWQQASVVVAILGIVFTTVIALVALRRDSGSDNELVEFHQVSAQWLVPRGTDQLGTPPQFSYQEDTAGDGHCDDWEPWLQEVGAAPAQSSAVLVVSAPADHPANLVSVEVDVLGRRPLPSETTGVFCGSETGGIEYSNLIIDVDTPAQGAIVSFVADSDLLSGLEEKVRIPPAAYSVDAGVVSGFLLEFAGDPNHIYDLVLQLEIIVDQESTIHEVGTESSPIRVIPSGGGWNVATVVDFVPGTCRWSATSAIDYLSTADWAC